MQMVGLTHPGDAIRVVLAPEESNLAQRAPSWASGYAISKSGVIVLLPRRVLSYPYDSLETVLVHEVAHVLIERAAQGHPVPRWFDEGLAMVAAQQWDLEDGARMFWAMVTGSPTSLDEVNVLFHQNDASAKRAYILAHAFVRHLLQKFGSDLPYRLFAFLRQGLSFQEAFARVSSMSLEKAEAAFWMDQTIWSRWVPVATSSAVLWLGIVGLAFYAFKKKRQRAEELKRQWQEEQDDAL